MKKIMLVSIKKYLIVVLMACSLFCSGQNAKKRIAVSAGNYISQPVGTIIASVLNYDQLCGSFNENPSFNAKKSTYAPCDGRSIDGSLLAKNTLNIKGNLMISTSPDLRGKFLRGLNIMYSPGQPATPFDSKRDGDPDGDQRIVTSLQADEFKAHSHNLKITGPHSSPNRPTNGGGENPADNTGSYKTEDSGGNETRPRNIAVYYYIKIN